MKAFALGLASLSLAATAEAASIKGEIHVTQFGSVALIDFNTNTVSFSPATNNSIVSFVTGDFAGLLGTSATYSSFRYDPLVVSNPLWITSGGAASFSLTSITSMDESPALSALDLSGTGFLTLDGFTPTPGLWSFSADSNNSAFSFSSTSSATNVPDGGTTAALFGLALLGLHGARRKFATTTK